MDVQMPVLDGYETTRLIRKLEEKTGKHVPITAMTAHARSAWQSIGLFTVVALTMLGNDIVRK